MKFESNDNLPLGKILNIPVYITAVESVLQKTNNYYLQVHLHEWLYEYK